MAQNLEHGYSANIDTRAVLWSLEMNDIFVRENTDVAYATSLGNITLAMQPGRNTLSLLFSPLTGKDQATGEYEFKLSNDVVIDIAIERTDFRSRERQEIGLLRIRYDEARQEFVSEAAPGAERSLKQPLLSSDGRYQITDLAGPEIVIRSGQRFGGYRLDVYFDVDDEALPPMVWAQDAVTLTDTPELRRELLQAYEHLYDRISKGDSEAIFRQAEPVWARSAFLLTSEPSARAYIESVEPGLAMFQPVRPDGAKLQPLSFVSDIQSASLQFMADNRLVRVRPDPLRWEDAPEGSQSFTTFPVVFYKSADGSWHLADINTGL